VLVAGTAPIGPDGSSAAPGDAGAQTRRCLDIIAEALHACGASLDDVVRTRVYLTRLQDWEAVAAEHGAVFGSVRPVATFAVVTSLLDPEWLVEIEAEAWRPQPPPERSPSREPEFVKSKSQATPGGGEPTLTPSHGSADHVLTILAVSDLSRATDFYRSAFGWPVQVEVPTYVEFVLPGGRGLGLYQREGFARNTGRLPVTTPPDCITGTEIYLRCPDLDAAEVALREAGAKPLSSRALRAWGDEAAYYADPDGNVVVVATGAR